ncbi:MAG TPA: response regulator [Polyangia bacterium]|nr:response regulator [Polyangia bacterium]
MDLERGALTVGAGLTDQLSTGQTARRVLIVEDDPALAENLQEIIGMLGHEAVAVPSAEAALAEIDEHHVDFILTDHRLPGMSGAALLRALRTTGRTIPSIMATAWIADPDADEASQAGLTEVLSKPIDIQRLLSLIRAALGPASSGTA